MRGASLLSRGVEGSLTLEGEGVRGLERPTVVELSEGMTAGDAIAGRGAEGRGRSPAMMVGPDVTGTYIAGIAEVADREW